MQQYFINDIAIIGQRIMFDPEQAHHIQHVLRMKNKDVVRISDQEQQLFFVSLEMEHKEVYGMVVEAIDDHTKSTVDIVLIQGLIKGEKWDYLIQKACELGVTTIVPFVSSRSVVKVVDEKMDKKLARWNKIALEACEQCKRSTLVKVLKPISFEDIPQYLSDFNIIAYEEADIQSEKLYSVLARQSTCTSISCVIGCEGGFNQDEVKYLNHHGFTRVSLGSRILRAETAALSIVNSIEFYYEMIGVSNDKFRKNITEKV